ncbi:hypothetical protein [Haloarchaeobius sp. DFWS5]|uniref:hypothetical protein n=1 Tax=Haloarchaeobius sp. DFWS5 TaxID=3446114 RepID=UPI003EC00366
MNRRHLLGALATSLPLVSGCLGRVQKPPVDDPGSYSRILDRDNFVDEDPEVQYAAEKVPRLSVTRATTQPAPAPSPEDAAEDAEVPPASDPDSRQMDDGTIRVVDEYWQHQTHVSEYGIDGVTVETYPSKPTFDSELATIYVAAFVYPHGKLVAEGTSDRFVRSDGPQSVAVELTLDAAPPDETLHYVSVLVSGDATVEDVGAANSELVMETDPFVVDHDADRIRPADRQDRLDDVDHENYSRKSIEGAYLQTLTGRTEGQNWRVSFLSFKSAYDIARNRSRGRARREYVGVELYEGAADDLAGLLADAAEANGFTTDHQKIEFAIDFVQRLPYVEDDVSTGFDDYTKFIMETLVDMQGDCEDTSIMLASILEAKPFSYDAILVQPPGHMAVGLYYPHEDGGYQYRYDERLYSYIETTGAGWGIGDIPDQYRGTDPEWYRV